MKKKQSEAWVLRKLMLTEFTLYTLTHLILTTMVWGKCAIVFLILYEETDTPGGSATCPRAQLERGRVISNPDCVAWVHVPNHHVSTAPWLWAGDFELRPQLSKGVSHVTTWRETTPEGTASVKALIKGTHGMFKKQQNRKKETEKWCQIIRYCGLLKGEWTVEV